MYTCKNIYKEFHLYTCKNTYSYKSITCIHVKIHTDIRVSLV